MAHAVFGSVWVMAEAVARALKNDGQYDIRLMDIEMPVMNGLRARELPEKFGKRSGISLSLPLRRIVTMKATARYSGLTN